MPFCTKARYNFYPRPPRGGRPAGLQTAIAQTLFLSTPSARRATRKSSAAAWVRKNFYPRPPRGGRPYGWLLLTVTVQFLSTPSARRATWSSSCAWRQGLISIHALREEGDLKALCWFPHRCNFYPRPPRGGRQQKQRENPLLLSHYTPPCTNCKEMPLKQTAKSRRYLHNRLVFRCEASRKTMCASCSHWPGIKKSARYPVQTPGAAQRARP